MYTENSVMYQDGFHNKIEGFALVTGGARGLGEAMVIQLAREGYDVVINHVSERSSEAARALAERVEKEFGVRAMTYRCDVAKYENCKAMFDAAVEKFGDKIAVLVNNAGIEHNQPFHKIKPEDYMRLIEIELFGSMHCTHIALPYMRAAENGSIINISSVGPQSGQIRMADYSAAKAGLIGFTKSVANENAHKGVRVNCIAPGLTLTPMVRALPEEMQNYYRSTVPMGRLGVPADIASAMSFLVNNTYVTGTTISVNGGSYMPAGC